MTYLLTSKAVQSASGLIGVAASFWESLGRDAPPPLQTAAIQLEPLP